MTGGPADTESESEPVPEPEPEAETRTVRTEAGHWDAGELRGVAAWVTQTGDERGRVEVLHGDGVHDAALVAGERPADGDGAVRFDPVVVDCGETDTVLGEATGLSAGVCVCVCVCARARARACSL